MILQHPLNIYALVHFRLLQPDKPDRGAIIAAVCEALKLERHQVNMSAGRRYYNVLGRHLCWKLIKESEPLISYDGIITLFGGGNHTTVMHGISAIEIRIKNEPAISDLYKSVKKKLHMA